MLWIETSSIRFDSSVRDEHRVYETAVIKRNIAHARIDACHTSLEGTHLKKQWRVGNQGETVQPSIGEVGFGRKGYRCVAIENRVLLPF
jgi:hypothetical protein